MSRTTKVRCILYPSTALLAVIAIVLMPGCNTLSYLGRGISKDIDGVTRGMAESRLDDDDARYAGR